GWMWFSITIAPVIGIIQISLSTPYTMADRYHYLPSIGLAIGLAWGIPALIKSEAMRKNILFPAGIIFLVIMALISSNQCGYWKNSITLYDHTLKVTASNWLAYYNRGTSYGLLGNHGQAIADFNKAIEIRPDYIKAYNNRGTAYNELGNYRQAIADFNEAIRMKPDYAEAYKNRGTVYLQQGQHQRALEDFNEAIRLKPDYADAYNNRGGVYYALGNSKLCCNDLQKACELGICNFFEFAKNKGYCRAN
ncbi:MAG: tetratricopeptide repeat protein, partial [Smithella sp.]